MPIKVDARLEMVRVQLADEIERIANTPVNAPSITVALAHAYRNGRLSALEFAVKVVRDVQEKTH